MFSLHDDGVYRSSLLEQLGGVSHGFGSREARQWAGEYVQVKQIHSNLVVAADDTDGACLPCADALTTAVPQRWIGVRTADCVPLLLADPTRRVVAAVHAGWRGTAAEIASRAVDEMVHRYGSEPGQLVAAIGPCIGECCFEVGADVAAVFDRLLPERRRRQYIDLAGANRRQLLDAGLRPENVEAHGLCTRCQPTHFHSYRRDGERAGRMISAICLD